MVLHGFLSYLPMPGSARHTLLFLKDEISYWSDHADVPSYTTIRELALRTAGVNKLYGEQVPQNGAAQENGGYLSYNTIRIRLACYD